MRIYLLLILCFIALPAFPQSRLPDSLYAELQKHKQEDTTRANLLNELSFRILKQSPQQSYTYAQQALTIGESLKYKKGIGEAENNLAVFHLLTGDTDQAMKLALDAVRVSEGRQQLTEILANSYAILGTVYHNQLDYNNALSHLAKAEKLTNNTLIVSKVLNARGGIARDKKQYDSALIHYAKALDVMSNGNEDYRLPEVLNNIGIIYTRQQKNRLAMEYYLKSLKVSKSTGSRRGQALALSNAGNLLLSEKKYTAAEDFLLQALAISKEIGDRKTLAGNYLALMQLKNENGKFDESHLYMMSYYHLKDSLLNVEKTKKIAELEIQYETEKKEHTIQLLNSEKKIQLLLKNIFLAGLVIVTLIFATVYFIQRYHERKNREILHLKIDYLTNEHNELSEKYKNFLTGGAKNATDSFDQRLLKKAILVVENNIADPLFSVEKMGQELGMSRTNMHRKVKAITGFPPSELIRSIRLRKAASLLMGDVDSVSQISFAVGFEDHSYFSKAFKKEFGVPPSEYVQFIQRTNRDTLTVNS